MELKNTTPVPNGIFEHMKILTGTELKALLLIVRSTLGWRDKLTGKRKNRDWIAHSQFVQKAGISDRSVTSAIQGLIEKDIIEVTDREGNSLKNPKDRQQCPQVFYGLAVETKAKLADTPAKNHFDRPQTLRTTKEILQKGSQQELPEYPQRELIERDEKRMQCRRDRWGR